MDSIKMKTGLRTPDEPSESVKTFFLVFKAVIWRRVWITTSIYSDHNKLNLKKSTVLKCLKYNIFSPSGIGNTLRPYIKKAVTDGYVMPNMYNKNLYAARAILMFKEALDVVRQNDRNLEIKFISDYAMKIFQIGSKEMDDSVREGKEIINSVEEFNIDGDETQKGEIPCQCKLCECINTWDIPQSLLYSEDEFENVIMSGLMSIAADM